jgi:L-aspartate oxidase
MSSANRGDGVDRTRTDVLVVGSGIAGLTFALKAAEEADVLLLTKKGRVESNTNYAQGGVAAAIAPNDSPSLHRRDTLLAGAGLCHTRAVEELAREGPERVRELVEWGVRFSREDGRLSLGREAGHSRRRILHAADLTGHEIERALLEAVAENPRIKVLDNHFVWELLTGLESRSWRSRCTGALALDVEAGRFEVLDARVVLLATGGSGRLYRHTTNPAIATGDGIALGYEAGAAVANLEFVQFHPTALYPAGSQAFLVSEAVRGEGAVLRSVDGRAFMEDVHPSGSLAPRDIVARAIAAELGRTGAAHVVLDLSALPGGRFVERFPTIAGACAERGLAVPDEPIPVVPAAHYQCGGLLTDWDGRTSLRGLYAAGEVACTGVHGANRLASNSLLEAVVYAHRAARRVLQELPDVPRIESRVVEAPPLASEGCEPEEVEEPLRELMWSKVGIVRSDEGLAEAREALTRLAARPVRSDGSGAGALRSRESAFLARVASLVVRCALRRRESRGLHYTESHPHRDSEHYLRDTVLAA